MNITFLCELLLKVADFVSHSSVLSAQAFSMSAELLDLGLGRFKILHEVLIYLVLLGGQVLGPGKLILSAAVLELFNLSP